MELVVRNSNIAIDLVNDTITLLKGNEKYSFSEALSKEILDSIYLVSGMKVYDLNLGVNMISSAVAFTGDNDSLKGYYIDINGQSADLVYYAASAKLMCNSRHGSIHLEDNVLIVAGDNHIEVILYKDMCYDK